MTGNEVSTLNLNRKSVPPYRAAILRYKGPPEAVGAAFAKLRSWVRDKDVVSDEAMSGYFFGRAGESQELLRVEVRAPLAVGADIESDTEEIEIVEVPACEVAYSVHRGPMADVADVVDTVLGWLDLTGVPHPHNDYIQVYVHTARETEDHWVIEVQVPVYPKAKKGTGLSGGNLAG